MEGGGGGGLNIRARGRLISRRYLIGCIFCFQVDGLITGGRGTSAAVFAI